MIGNVKACRLHSIRALINPRSHTAAAELEND